MKSIAVALASCLIINGCYSGSEQARRLYERVEMGMTRTEVRESFGEPDPIQPWMENWTPPDGEFWYYGFDHPLLLYILAYIGLFTVVFTWTCIGCLYGMGYARGGVSITFGPDGRVIGKDLNPQLHIRTAFYRTR